RELQAPECLDVARPARDARGRVVVAVGVEVRAAVPGGDRRAAGAARGAGGGAYVTRPSGGIRLTSAALAAGFIPGATLSLGSPKRRIVWLVRQVPTVYRKESSACGEAARAMRGNHWVPS